MKTILGIIIGLALGLAIGLTGDVLATPPPTTGSTEARLQNLEYLMWTKQHAINYVAQRVSERATSCQDSSHFSCYGHDPILMAFNSIHADYGW
jgi:hypothetical protein